MHDLDDIRWSLNLSPKHAKLRVFPDQLSMEEKLNQLQQRQTALETKLDAFASQALDLLQKLSETQKKSEIPRKKSFKIYERDDANYSSSSDDRTESPVLQVSSAATSPIKASGDQSRVILTTYPGQVGILPIPMIWGSSDPKIRGPIVASRNTSSIKKRNATGAHGGSYAVC